MAAVDHQKGDVQVKVVTNEQTRWRRQLKETLTIHRLDPTLNEDDGAYKLPAVYTNIPKFGTRSNRLSKGTAIPKTTSASVTAIHIPTPDMTPDPILIPEGTAIPNTASAQMTTTHILTPDTAPDPNSEIYNTTAEIYVPTFNLDEEIVTRLVQEN